MNSKKTKILFIIFIFFLLTSFFTYPLIFRMGSWVHDLGDPLLNSWIIAWDIHALTTDPLNLFNANIFYPLSKTLTYSENLLPTAIMAAPIYLISENPILAYNFALLLSYIIAGVGAYLLVKRITKSDLAGIFAGIVFAFNPFKMDHLSHLQIQSCGFIPFTLLYLHKFIEKPTVKNSFFLSFFFFLQALSCLYYGLFLAVSLFLITIPLLLVERERVTLNTATKLIIGASPPILLLIAIAIPYHQVFSKLGFERPILEGADLTSYLATSSINLIYGKITASLGDHELRLSLGIIPILLTLFLLKKPLLKMLRSIWTLRAGNGKWAKRGFITLDILIAISGFNFLFTLLLGGYVLKLGALKISSHSPINSFYIFFILFLIKVILVNRKILPTLSEEGKAIVTYSFLGFFALLFSMGKTVSVFGLELGKGPYHLLHNYVPGFREIRVPGRFAIMAGMSLVVLSSIGFKRLVLARGGRKSIIIASIILILLSLEYISIPLPMEKVPVGKEVPEVYRFLAKEKGDFAIVEIPFLRPIPQEAIYVYFSSYHFKKLVNGYSGYFPPTTYFFHYYGRKFPNRDIIDILQYIGVKYVVVHLDKMGKHKRKYFRRNLAHFGEELKLKKRFGSDLLFVLSPRKVSLREIKLDPTKEIPPSLWRAKANFSNEFVRNAYDRDYKTRWSPGRPQSPGEIFEVEFNKREKVAKIAITPGAYTHDFPRKIIIEKSDDGENWEIISPVRSPASFLFNQLLENPKHPWQVFIFPPVETKYLRLLQMGKDPVYWWSIYEITFYRE